MPNRSLWLDTLTVLRTMNEFRGDALAFYERLQRERVGVTYAPLSIASFYFVSDPLLIEEVLLGKHRECVKDRITRLLIPLLGHSMVTTDGEPWRKRRKLSAQAFAPKHIRTYADSMVASARRFVDGYHDGERPDFHRDVMALTLDVVARTILGFDAVQDAQRIADAMDEAIPFLEGVMFTLGGQLGRVLPTPRRLRFMRAKRELDAIVARIVERARAAGPDSEFLLARLAHAQDEQGSSLRPDELAAETITFLLAGHETTALTIQFCAYLLSIHPDVAARVRAELDHTLGERSVGLDDLEQLPLLRAVVKETLRLFPPAPVFAREVAVPFYLGTHELKRGEQLLFSPYAMHRDPRYFPEPLRFRPERFLDGSTDGLPKLAYLPFGGGPRVCIGQYFATMEAELLLATLLQHVEIEVPESFRLELVPVITMRSRHQMPVRVRRRTLRAQVDAPVAAQ